MCELGPSTCKTISLAITVTYTVLKPSFMTKTKKAVIDPKKEEVKPPMSTQIRLHPDKKKGLVCATQKNKKKNPSTLHDQKAKKEELAYIK